MRYFSRREAMSMFNRRVVEAVRGALHLPGQKAARPPGTAEEAGLELGRSVRPLRPFSAPSQLEGDPK